MNETAMEGTGSVTGGLWSALVLSTGVQAAATLAVLALAMLAPLAAADLGIGAQWVGLQVSLIYFAAMTVSSVSGVLVSRFGAGSVSQGALVIAALGCVGVALGSVFVVAGASLMIGIAYGLTNPAASQLLSRRTPSGRRNIVFSIKQTGVPIGGFTAGLLLPALAATAGWRVAALASGAVATVFAVALVPFRTAWNVGRNPSAPLRGSLLAAPILVLGNRRLRIFSIAAFCFSAMQMSLITYAVTLLVQGVGWSLVTAGAALSLMQVAGAGGRIFWGVVADRIGRGDVVLAALGAGAALAGLLMTGVSSNTPTGLVFTLLGFFGVCSIGWNGVFLAEIAGASAPEEVGAATGGALVLTFMGVVIGPSVFSVLFTFMGSYPMAFGGMAAFPLAGAALILLGLRKPPAG
jgi:MFS family permease